MVDFKNTLQGIPTRLVLAVLAVVFAGSVVAQSRDERIAERLKPAGEVCLAGDTCAGGAGLPSAATAAAPAAFDAEQTYQQSCAMCHNSGMAGAPKLGDDEWNRRVADKGLETIVQNAINGINAMPARGMCMTCSDENIAEIVDYLVGSAQ